LLGIELLASSVPFDHEQRSALDRLERGEPLTALLALAPTANPITLGRDTRVGDAGVCVATIRALHGTASGEEQDRSAAATRDRVARRADRRSESSEREGKRAGRRFVEDPRAIRLFFDSNDVI